MSAGVLDADAAVGVSDGAGVVSGFVPEHAQQRAMERARSGFDTARDTIRARCKCV
jgi:hypothetical protein